MSTHSDDSIHSRRGELDREPPPNVPAGAGAGGPPPVGLGDRVDGRESGGALGADTCTAGCGKCAIALVDTSGGRRLASFGLPDGGCTTAFVLRTLWLRPWFASLPPLCDDDGCAATIANGTSIDKLPVVKPTVSQVSVSTYVHAN